MPPPIRWRRDGGGVHLFIFFEGVCGGLDRCTPALSVDGEMGGGIHVWLCCCRYCLLGAVIL